MVRLRTSIRSRSHLSYLFSRFVGDFDRWAGSGVASMRQTRSTTAFRRRCYWLFDGGMAMLFRIKDGHLWTWISFLYFLRCLFGRFVRFKSGLKLSIDCHIKLLDERRLGAYWRRIGSPAFRSRTSPSAWEFSPFVRCHHRQSSLASRFTAGAFEFLTFTQCGERPER